MGNKLVVVATLYVGVTIKKVGEHCCFTKRGAQNHNSRLALILLGMLQLLENSYTMGNKLILQSCSYLSYMDAITECFYQALV